MGGFDVFRVGLLSLRSSLCSALSGAALKVLLQG